MPETITISDLEVFYRVGVPDEERATPQRLLLTFKLEVDISAAAITDDLAHTIDYFAVTQDVMRFGEGRSWKLIEKLASDLADFVLEKYRPPAVSVEVKKFVIPQTRFVSVSIHRKAKHSK